MLNFNFHLLYTKYKSKQASERATLPRFFYALFFLMPSLLLLLLLACFLLAPPLKTPIMKGKNSLCVCVCVGERGKKEKQSDSNCLCKISQREKQIHLKSLRSVIKIKINI